MAAQWPSAVSTAANLYTTVNLLQTTLSGTINSAVTTIALTSTSGFPTAGAVTIDNEVIFYTNISGGNLTGCVRGSDGTTAATHNSGVPVGATVVAYHVNSLNAEVIAIEQNLSTRFGLGSTDVKMNAGNVLIGPTTSNTIGAVVPTLQVEGLTAGAARPSFTLDINSAAGPQLQLAKSRGTSLGSYTIVQNGDFLGGISWLGANGVDLSAQGAYIFTKVNGTPSATSMPTQMDLAVTKIGDIGATVALSLFPSLNATFFGDVNVNGSGSPNFYVTSSTGGGVQLRMLASGTTAGYIQTNTAHPLYFTTNNGVNALTIETNKTVTIPNGSLFIGPNNASSDTEIAKIQFVTDVPGVRWAGIQGWRNSDAANISLRFYTMAGDSGGVLERMRISPDGKVSVNTTADTVQMEIVGTGTSAPAATGTTPGAGTVLRLAGNNNAIMDFGSNTSTYQWIQAYDRTALNAVYPLYLNPVGGAVSITNTNLQVSGKQTYPIVQVVSAVTSTTTTTSSSTLVDTNLTVTITPKFSTSKILVLATGNLEISSTVVNNQAIASLVRNTSTLIVNQQVTILSQVNGVNNLGNIAFAFYDSPATTSATVYKVQIARQISGGSASALFPATGDANITVIEIAQ